jgi:hypothetical protein
MSEGEYANSVFRGFQYFDLIERLCRILGIDLFWGTWDRYCSISLKNSELFSNYVDIGDAKDFYEWANKNKYTVKDLTARDNFHGGRAYHNYWSEKLFKAYKEKF